MQRVTTIFLAMILYSYCGLCSGQVESVNCNQMPCKNGGTCSFLSFMEGSATINSFQCACPLGTLHPLCDSRASCNQGNPCMNSGSCFDVGNNQCLCNFGGVLPFCSDDCRGTSCQNGGTCTHYGLCLCPAGFTGITCEEDIDECSTNNGNCPFQASCRNTMGSFRCVCPDGYFYNGVTCQDIDECSTNNGNCPFQASCRNTMGSFRCVCPDGYFYNGVTCQDIDECSIISLNDCSPVATCANSAGSFICTCRTGYSGDGVSCEDNIGPTISNCPSSPIVVYIDVRHMEGEARWDEPTATDVSGGVHLVSQTHAPGNIFQEGKTEVEYKFADRLNNMASCHFNVIVNADCPALIEGNPLCNDTSCRCSGDEVCDSNSGSCSRSCSVFECPAGIESKSLSTVNPFSSVMISCSLNASTAVLDGFDVRLSKNESSLVEDGIVQYTAGNISDHQKNTTFRVANVTGEEELYCVLIRGTDLVGGVRVIGFVYELPSLNTAPYLITKSNTSVTVGWTAWDPQRDVGDPPLLHYIPYYRMNASEVWIPASVQVQPANMLEFRAEDLEVDTVYEFSVAAVREGENGEGPRSPSVTVKTFCNVPTFMVEVTVRLASSNGVNVSWQLPPGDVMCSTGVTKFTIYYKKEGSIGQSHQQAGTVDSSMRWFVIEERSFMPGSNYSFFVTFTTDQESHFSGKTEKSVLEFQLVPTVSTPEESSAHLYLIILIIIPVSLVAVVVFFIIRYQRKHNSKNKKTTKADHGEDSDYVNAAVADDPEDYIPLETQSKSTSSSKYEGINLKPQTGVSIPPQYEVTIAPKPQKPVAAARIQTRNTKEVLNSSAYESVGASSKKRHLPGVPQTHPSGDEDEDTFYEVPDRLEEYTGVYVNVKSKNRPAQPGSIKVAQFQRFMTRNKEDVVTDIVHQFMALPSGGQYPWSAALKFQNKPRNFYKTILPYDHSRVKLDTAGSDARSDYINANYIKNREGKISFIAAQGPRESTLDDFWKMVWQENVEIIVMVTDNVEKNKHLCGTYWPSKVHMSEVFDDITVLLMESTSYKTHTIRKLNLLKGNHKAEVHTVTQIQVHSWSYGGVPEEATSLISIIKKLKTELSDGSSSPLLVHCSNGVGATGTFIAAYALMDIINKNKDVSVFDFVKQMRDDRVDMVQTRIQYLFIFEFLLAVVQSTDSQMSCDHLKKLGRAAIKQKSKKEFKVLQESVVTEKHSGDCVGNSPENQHKNRFSSLVPEDKFRPVLKSQGNTYGSNSYINAFHLPDFGGREFIMTQTPLTSTVEDFWRLVFDYECTAVVMLNIVGGSDKTVVQYWPGGGSAQYGLITVECVSLTKSDSCIQSQFQVAHRLVEEKSLAVNHFAFCGWSGNEPDVSKLSQFIRHTGSGSSGPVLVHCINGVGLSAVYVITKTESDKMEQEGFVDVFQSLEKLRKNCPPAIQTGEEYALCYQLLKDHLENPEEYSVVY